MLRPTCLPACESEDTRGCENYVCAISLYETMVALNAEYSGLRSEMGVK